MGGCQQLSHRKGACFLLNNIEALSGLIQVNDDEVWHPGLIPVYQKNSSTLYSHALEES